MKQDRFLVQQAGNVYNNLMCTVTRVQHSFELRPVQYTTDWQIQFITIPADEHQKYGKLLTEETHPEYFL